MKQLLEEGFEILRTKEGIEFLYKQKCVVKFWHKDSSLTIFNNTISLGLLMNMISCIKENYHD